MTDDAAENEAVDEPDAPRPAAPEADEETEAPISPSVSASGARRSLAVPWMTDPRGRAMREFFEIIKNATITEYQTRFQAPFLTAPPIIADKSVWAHALIFAVEK